jgi:hypothetical protein
LKYLTTDECNAANAQALAERHDLPLEVIDPRDIAQLQLGKAYVVLDFDFLQVELREDLLNGSPVKVVAVHGYQLPAWASFLARRGIVVSSRLDDQLFLCLARMASAA